MFSKRRFLQAAFLGALVLASVPGRGQEKGKEITHQVSVRAITVAVTVQDRSGRYINDLGRDDFTVLENGQKKPITYFKHDYEAPLSLAVLLDVSGSMALLDRLKDCRAALAAFATELLGPADEISLLIFADGQVEVAVPYSGDKTRFLAVLEKTEAFGRTALNDAVAVSPEFANRGRNEKRALLLLTDGIENDSRTSPEEALEIARRVDVPIYTIGYRIPLSEQLLQERKRRAGATTAGIIDDLQKFSLATGGRAFISITPSELKGALGEIRRELSHQYLMGYTSHTESGGEYRSLRVLTSNKRYLIRTRQGY
jgi:Ca-activated chloride channel homolog